MIKNLNQKTCYIIAEAGLNHNGSLDIAMKLIDVAAVAGVDAVKFQKRTVEKLAIGQVLDANDDRFPAFGKTYREIREHLEFDSDEYRLLKEYTESKGLDFIVTAFDLDAVDFLENLGVKRYKLASHSLTNIELLKYIASTKKQIILSTGMAELDEIDNAVEILKQQNSALAIMHCVSAYPTPIDECNLKMVDVLNERYGLPTGYSGHEIGYLPTLIAVARGAQLIERHFTLDKNMAGFDHKISLEPAELIAMVKGIRSITEMVGNGLKSVSESEWVTRRKYHVSMVAKHHIPTGTVLDQRMVTYKNPGTGIPYKESFRIIGKRSVRTIQADEMLSLEMFEQE
jgi:sialic acid synthase SpsE